MYVPVWLAVIVALILVGLLLAVLVKLDNLSAGLRKLDVLEADLIRMDTNSSNRAAGIREKIDKIQQEVTKEFEDIRWHNYRSLKVQRELLQGAFLNTWDVDYIKEHGAGPEIGGFRIVYVDLVAYEVADKFLADPSRTVKSYLEEHIDHK